MIFATLLLCGREDLLLTSFFTRPAQFCDKDLPLRLESLQVDNIDYNLTEKEKELLIHSQWHVYTPFLKKFDIERGQDVESLPEQVSLPWARKERIGQQMPGEVSYVEQVEIHLHSHNLVGDTVNTSMQEILHPNLPQTPHNAQLFALKTFEQRLAPGLSKKRFQHEVKANLEAPKHDRIVRLLTAFTYRERFYILFPHATEGSLENLWKSYAPPGVAQESAEVEVATWYTDDWLVRECLGIASALAATHGFVDLPNEAKALLHADIKPENILCFRKPGSNTPVVLKLADFGEAKLIDPSNPLKANKVAHVMTYRPPEHFPESQITLNYDVWSLGCLFLDFVTWAILGQDGVDSFSTDREDEQDSSAQLIEDTFFRRDPGSFLSTKLRPGSSKKSKVENGRSTTKYSLWVASHVKLTSRLKDGVVSVSANVSISPCSFEFNPDLHLITFQQLEFLQQHDRCSEQLRKVLWLVGESMLVADPEKRADSLKVRDHLNDLLGGS